VLFRSVVILAGIKADDEVVTSAQFLLDSESSKSSDFKRMQTPDISSTVWSKGVINQVMTANRRVNISHEPIEELDWPKMTMDFTVADDVDFQALQAGQTLHFELTKNAQSSYIISAIHIMDSTNKMNEADNEASVTGTINHIDKATREANISRGAIEK